MISLKISKTAFCPVHKIALILSTKEPGAVRIIDYYTKNKPDQIINVCNPKPTKDGKGRGLMPRNSLIILDNGLLVLSSVPIGWLQRSLKSLENEVI